MASWNDLPFEIKSIIAHYSVQLAFESAKISQHTDETSTERFRHWMPILNFRRAALEMQVELRKCTREVRDECMQRHLEVKASCTTAFIFAHSAHNFWDKTGTDISKRAFAEAVALCKGLSKVKSGRLALLSSCDTLCVLLGVGV